MQVRGSRRPSGRMPDKSTEMVRFTGTWAVSGLDSGNMGKVGAAVVATNSNGIGRESAPFCEAEVDWVTQVTRTIAAMMNNKPAKRRAAKLVCYEFQI